MAQARNIVSEHHAQVSYRALGSQTTMTNDPRSSGNSVDPRTFLSRVNRLAKNPPSQSTFHLTRQPFLRLRGVIGRLRMDRVAQHPSCCQAPGCSAPLTEGYHRRADGLTLCPACFRSRQEAGRVDGERG